jgi:hypothetical protein
MKIIRYIFSLVFALACGCTQNNVSTAQAPVPSPQAQTAFSTVQPKADDIIEFKTDVIPARTHFKDFKVERNDIEEVLRTWYQVSQEHWRHGYSHVALEDRTGKIKLKDGTTIRWLVRPGGLAKLTLQDGTALHLARELTPWEKEELQLTCSMTRTEFTVGEKLLPPKVTLRNNTDADIDLIGPTITVIACTLLQPDKTTVPMRIAMPTGRDPQRMPPRKLKAETMIELTAAGIWYYEEASGFEPYVFQKEGTYEFKCKYEEIISNIITITVRKDTELTAPETTTAEKRKIAYTFLLKKLKGDNVNLIAAKDDKNLGLIQKIIHTNKFNLKVENYNDVEEGPDLCYYSKCTKETVAIIDVTKRNEKNYYVSYYIGPEGGASKEILVEKRKGMWTVVNDDGMWNVK